MRPQHFPLHLSQQEKQIELEDVVRAAEARAGINGNVKMGRKAHKVVNIQRCHNWLHEYREIVSNRDNR